MNRRAFLLAPLCVALPAPAMAPALAPATFDGIPFQVGTVRLRFSATADPALSALFDDLAAARRRARHLPDAPEGGAGPGFTGAL